MDLRVAGGSSWRAIGFDASILQQISLVDDDILLLKIYLHSCPHVLTKDCYSRLGFKPVSHESRVHHPENKPKYFLRPHMPMLTTCKTVFHSP